MPVLTPTVLGTGRRWIVHGEMADTVFYGLRKKYWQKS
jgi:hypothetical protein